MEKENTTAKSQEKTNIIFEPIQGLEGFDIGESEGFMCDIETGLCGPENKEKESK